MLQETSLSFNGDGGTLFSASASDRRRAEAVYDAWMRRLKRGGVFAERVTITPALCEIMLEKNPDNRKPSALAIAKYASDMSGGRWQFNGEAVVVANSGEVNDGQHRLHACVKAGKPFDTMLVFGVERETRETLDIGKGRTSGDHLHMKGYGNANQLAHAGRCYWQLENLGRITDSSLLRPTTTQINEIIEENPLLQESISWGRRAMKANLGGVGLMAALRAYLGEGRPVHDEMFFEPLVEGVGLKASDPAHLLRKKLSEKNNRLKEVERALLTVKAWNAYRTKANVRLLKIAAGEEFPKAE